MGGEAERRLHFQPGLPPPPLEEGMLSHGCGPLARRVLPTRRRLASRSRGLGP